jgi:Ca-activated chloride channel homolog
MSNRSRLSLFALPLILGSVTVGMVACSANESDGGFGEDPTSGNGQGGSGVGPGPVGSATVGVGTGAGNAGEFPQPPPPPDTQNPDAGADAAELSCTDLDPSKPVVLYLSADDSNSMASPVHVRELLGLGVEPLPQEVRTYEFLNYYRVAYPAAPAGKLSLFPELDATVNPGEFDFQIAVRSFDAIKPRRPMTITFVLDTSGSMGGPGIERERAAVKAIASSLAEGDVVNAVTWNTANNIVLSGHAVTGPNDPTVVAMANALAAEGGTDLHSGLVQGYKLAEANYGLSRLNRVILISDGGANVGETDADFIGTKSEDADKEGIYLVGIGTGPGLGYYDALMNIVTDKGRGAYIYLDEPTEAGRMFGSRFDETMEIAARGVQVELTMPWYFQMHKFFGEEYSPNAEEIEPQHLAPSDAMIFNQVLKACDISQIIPSDEIIVRARWKTPLTYVEQSTEVKMTVADLLAAEKSGLVKAKAIVAYAEALKAPSAVSIQEAHAAVVAANKTGADPELLEIAKLLEKHPQF